MEAITTMDIRRQQNAKEHQWIVEVGWGGKLTRQVLVKRESSPFLIPKSGVLTPDLSDIPGDDMERGGPKNLGFE